jgi:hypothetical protein
MVLERSGRIDEAREALGRALAVWEDRRCLPCVRRVCEKIDSLGWAGLTRTNDSQAAPPTRSRSVKGHSGTLGQPWVHTRLLRGHEVVDHDPHVVPERAD